MVRVLFFAEDFDTDGGYIRAILHNEKTYPEPNTFRPERFLNEDGSINPNVPDPIVSFGFGRRFVLSFQYAEFALTVVYSICPGRHLATNGALIMVASILSVFDIRPPMGEDTLDVARGGQIMTSGLISYVINP